MLYTPFHHLYSPPLPTAALQVLEVDRQLLVRLFYHLNLDLCLVRPVWESLRKSSTDKNLRYEWCYWKRMATLKKKKKSIFTESFLWQERSIFTNILLLFSIFKLTLYCCILSFIAVVLQHCNLMRCSMFSDDLIIVHICYHQLTKQIDRINNNVVHSDNLL